MSGDLVARIDDYAVGIYASEMSDDFYYSSGQRRRDVENLKSLYKRLVENDMIDDFIQNTQRNVIVFYNGKEVKIDKDSFFRVEIEFDENMEAAKIYDSSAMVDIRFNNGG